MTSKERKILWAAGIAFVLLMICCFIALRPTLDNVEWEKQEYYVQRGDMLWEIAGRYCPDNVDRREWINKVKSINNMTSSEIWAGQTIILIVPKNK